MENRCVIKIRVLRKVFSEQFLIKGGIAVLTLLRTLLAIYQKSQESSFWEVMDSFVLLAYVSLGASRTFLQWLACLNFPLEADLSFWYKQKKWFLWAMAAAQAAENHGDEWGLTILISYAMKRGIPLWIWWKANGNWDINMISFPMEGKPL